MQAGILDGDQVGGSARLVVVAVPQPGGVTKAPAGSQSTRMRVDDGAVGVEPDADQRVAARCARR